MRPVQVWLPTLGGSINRTKAGRDAVRGLKEWREELVVWTLPELRKLRRWREDDGIRHLAVRAEQFERINIVHVDEDGWIYAPTLKGRTPRKIDGLLDEWLNVNRSGGVRFVPPAESISVTAPRFQGSSRVSWVKRSIAIGAGAYMPFDSINRKSRTVSMKWPPEGSPAPISPESESAERYPSRKLSADPPEVITEQGDKALHVFLRWPERLQWLMPPLSGPDDIHAQAEMERLARISRSDLPGALRAAVLAAHPYLFEGHTTIEHSWLQPALAHKGVKHALSKAEDHGLMLPAHLRSQWNESSLSQALKDTNWQKWLAEPVAVRRAWGGVGLFWTLLLDSLQAHRSFGVCQRCRRVIAGAGRKRFCSENDDVECFRSRRALDQRRSRSGDAHH